MCPNWPSNLSTDKLNEAALEGSQKCLHRLQELAGTSERGLLPFLLTLPWTEPCLSCTQLGPPTPSYKPTFLTGAQELEQTHLHKDGEDQHLGCQGHVRPVAGVRDVGPHQGAVLGGAAGALHGLDSLHQPGFLAVRAAFARIAWEQGKRGPEGCLDAPAGRWNC